MRKIRSLVLGALAVASFAGASTGALARSSGNVYVLSNQKTGNALG